MKLLVGVQKASLSPLKRFIISWILSHHPLTLRKSLISSIFPHISCFLNLPFILYVFPKKSCQPSSTSLSPNDRLYVQLEKPNDNEQPAQPHASPIPVASGSHSGAAWQAGDSPRLRCGCAASSGAVDGPARSWVDCSEVGAGGRWTWWCGSCGPQRMPRGQSTQWSMYATHCSQHTCHFTHSGKGPLLSNHLSCIFS